MGTWWRGTASSPQPCAAHSLGPPYPLSQSIFSLLPPSSHTKPNSPTLCPGSGPSPRPQGDSPRHQGAERAADRECRGQARCAGSFWVDRPSHLQGERPLFPSGGLSPTACRLGGLLSHSLPWDALLSAVSQCCAGPSGELGYFYLRCCLFTLVFPKRQGD